MAPVADYIYLTDIHVWCEVCAVSVEVLFRKENAFQCFGILLCKPEGKTRKEGG